MDPSASAFSLKLSAAAWQQADFQAVAKREIENLPASMLPLQQALARGSHVSNEPFAVTILNTVETPECILVKAGIFFSSIIAGCSCADDPTPIETLPEYCIVRFAIDRLTAATTIELISE